MEFRLATLLIFFTTSTLAQINPVYEEAMLGTTKDDMNNHLAKELIYPDEARSNNIEGLTVFRFKVDTTGHIDSINNVSTPSMILSQEAIRVILLTDGKWKPAKRNGMHITSWHYLTVSFKLDEGRTLQREMEEGNYYFNEGLEYYKDSQDADAINAFIIAQKLNPARADALYNVALIYQNSTMWSKIVGSD